MEQNETTSQIITTSYCRMQVKEGNLVFVNLFENASIEIPEVEEMHKHFNTLVNNELCYLIVTPALGSTSSEEARRHAARLKSKNVVAEALIINNLATRLLANFYIKINRPEQKIKIFSDTTAALVWINSIRTKSA